MFGPLKLRLEFALAAWLFSRLLFGFSRVMRALLSVCLAGFAWIGSPAPLLAQTNHCAAETGPPGTYSWTSGKPFTFCNGCRYAFELRTRPSTPCIGTIRVGPFPLSIAELRVTRRAQSGLAGIAGQAAYAYSPKAGFRGRDQFSLDVDYLTSSGRRETTHLDFTIDVQ